MSRIIWKNLSMQFFLVYNPNKETAITMVDVAEKKRCRTQHRRRCRKAQGQRKKQWPRK
jgi:hypothetical protein